MTLKSAVLNIIAPQFEKYGFALTCQESRCYCFENASTEIEVSITVPPRCPFELLNEYVKALERKNQGDKDIRKAAFVSLRYSSKRPEGGYINLSPYSFEPFMGITGDFLYCNDRELEENALQMVSETVSIVIPYLEQLTKRFIGFERSEALEDILAQDPKALARRTAEKFGLPYDYAAGYGEIEPALFSLRGQNEEAWKSIFDRNLEDIVGFSAYFGECIAARAITAEWVWETTPEIQTSDGICESTKELYYSVQHKNGCMDLRPAQIICDLWNYYPHVMCRHIEAILQEML